MEERLRRLLIKQNPWWVGEKVKLPKFERDMLQNVLKYAKHKQVIAITGLRRVGKTVLMKQLMQKLNAKSNNLCYVSFDDIEFQDYKVTDSIIQYFLEFSDKTSTRYLFLDEVQKLPNWADLLKVYYDTEENLKIFISGSASLDISKQKETLAGRILTFHLPVLSFREFTRYFSLDHTLNLKGIEREYDLKLASKKMRYEKLFREYVIKGAFPELLEEDDEEFIKKYIRESVVEKSISDIARLAKEDEKIIYELFRLLANSNAQLFEILNLAATLKINRNLVSKYISLLEKSFLLRVNYNFTASVAKQVRASKKQHIAHSSIIIALLDYPFSIVETPAVGNLVESIISNSFEKAPFFWRTIQKDEVDIVIKQKETIPIEVKYRTQITNSDLRTILKFCKQFKTKKTIMVTKDILKVQTYNKTKVIMVPAWLFLLIKEL